MVQVTKTNQHNKANSNLVNVKAAEKNILLDKRLVNEESVVSVKCAKNGAENGEKQTIKITLSRNSIGNYMKKKKKKR